LQQVLLQLKAAAACGPGWPTRQTSSLEKEGTPGFFLYQINSWLLVKFDAASFYIISVKVTTLIFQILTTMKDFLLANWYKLITATCMLIIACGFFVFAVKHNTAKAGAPAPAIYNQATNTWVVTMGNKFYEVTWHSLGRTYSCREICD